MKFFRKLIILSSLFLFLMTFTSGQDLDNSNEDSSILLTLSQPEKSSESPPPVLLSLLDVEKDSKEVQNTNTIDAPSTSPDAAVHKPSAPITFLQSLIRPQNRPQNRPSLVQAFLAGRATAASGTRPTSPIVEAVRNFNVTSRLANVRERVGRFRIPRLETNDQSLAYRAGRRVGLFFQGIGKRARALAARLRARAATATPTAY